MKLIKDKKSGTLRENATEEEMDEKKDNIKRSRLELKKLVK
jgi:hypothetical protein